MKASSYPGSKILQNLAQFFDKRQLNRLAKQSGFGKRSPKKITPFAFIAGFIQACLSRGGTHLQQLGHQHWPSEWQGGVQTSSMATHGTSSSRLRQRSFPPLLHSKAQRSSGQLSYPEALQKKCSYKIARPCLYPRIWSVIIPVTGLVAYKKQ